jgi:transposase
LLLKNAIEYPEAPAGGQWSNSVIKKLRDLSSTSAIRFKLDRLLDQLEWSKSQALKTQVALRAMLASDKELSESMRYLMSLPGVGWIIASYALARIGDWRLLRHSDEMAAFFGLVPTENSTGDHENKGEITKAGDRRLRSMMIQGAWMAIHKDPELREFYLRIVNNHPKNTGPRVAIVAVARKIATRMHCVLRERRDYVSRGSR